MPNEFDTESGWDSLAEELGVEPKTPAPTERLSAPSASRVPSRPARDPRPEIEGEANDFGSGLVEDPGDPAEALYDPGPGTIEEEEPADFEEVAAEQFEEAYEGGDEPVVTDTAEGQEGGKRKRRRRRRKKKGGAPTESPETVSEAAAEDENGVEEGEAPAEVEDDEDDGGPVPAMDEELEEETSQPRPEWNVMSWAELVSKLYRPS